MNTSSFSADFSQHTPLGAPDMVIRGFLDYLGVQFLYNNRDTLGNSDSPEDVYTWLREKMMRHRLLIIKPEDLHSALQQDDWVIIVTPATLVEADQSTDKIGIINQGQIANIDTSYGDQYVFTLFRTTEGLLRFKDTFNLSVHPFRCIVMKVVGTDNSYNS